MRKHASDLSLFAILLSLLFLPIGSLGLAGIKESDEGVLSVVNERPSFMEDVSESSESTSFEQEEEILEEGITAPIRNEDVVK